MILTILWTPLVARYESIFQGLVSLECYIAPPITAVFVWGVFWRRSSSTAAITTLFCGSFLGLVVFLLDWFKETTGWNVFPMMAGFYLFVICSVIMYVVSWFRPHKHTAQSEILVWNSLKEALNGKPWKGFGNYKFLAALLFVVFVGLYIIFGK